MSEVQPPAYSIHEIHLREGPDGKDPGGITEVNVYPSRAEVCRSYRLKVASGQNKAVVYGLTNVLNHDSLRVEGRGKATIQDVTISREVPDRAPSTSPTLQSLKVDKEDLTAAIQRCEKTISGLDHYFRSLDVKHAATNSDASHPTVLPLFDDYHTASEKYDTKLLSLKRQLKKLETAIIEEEKALQASVRSDSNRLMKVTVLQRSRGRDGSRCTTFASVQMMPTKSTPWRLSTKLQSTSILERTGQTFRSHWEQHPQLSISPYPSSTFGTSASTNLG